MTALLAPAHLGGLPGDAERLADLLPGGAGLPSLVDEVEHGPVDGVLQPASVVQRLERGLVILGVGERGDLGVQVVDVAALADVARQVERAAALELFEVTDRLVLRVRHGVKCGLTWMGCQGELDEAAQIVAPDHCQQHANVAVPGNCGDCADTRKANQARPEQPIDYRLRVVPNLCGECDERWIETPTGLVKCPRCYPRESVA